MIKSIRLKKYLTNCIFPFFSTLNKMITKKDNKILIYCANDELTDNSKYIFEYLLNNRYNEKYKVYVNCKNKVSIDNNVKVISKISTIFHYMTSGHIFYSEGKLPIIPTNNQIVINMWHGVPLKKIGLLSKVSNGKEYFFTWVCAPSELFRPIMAHAFGCPENKVFICGEAKVDALFSSGMPKDYKTIVWAPTFRTSKSLGYNDSHMQSMLPIFSDNEWDELEDFLRDRNIKIVIKLHRSQDLNGFYKKEYRHLKIYSDSAFREEGMELWDLLSQADALISDYSSVYINYLVLNRPICFAIPDIEDYSDTRGFVFDNPLDYMPGIHARTKEDIYHFIEQVESNEDEYKEKREEIGRLMNKYHDGKNCKRIIQKSGLSR